MKMSKSALAKLLMAIIIIFIISIPELFKTLKGNSMILSCSDTCSSDTTHTSLRCFLQQSDQKNFLETFSTNKQNISTIILNVCMNTSHDHSQRYRCYPNKYLDPFHEHMNSSGDKAQVSFEIRGTYLVHPYEKHYFLLVNSKEDNKTSFSLEIHPLNVSATTDSFNSPFVGKELKGQNGHMSVSLQFELYVPYYLDTLGIFWLVLISAVFVLALYSVVYKIFKVRKKSAAKIYLNDRGTTVKNKEENLFKHYSHKEHNVAEDKNSKVQVSIGRSRSLSIIQEQ
ncbi:transmembrane protein 156-like isoform X2 [Xenopus laevis]|uniref:Transmembrane protein 156-like isoform X2 n=1 Tax=Xenopus laevis TaxID=8355 RepID=A0A8J1M215_XENLA|nr:transmembrane protein 156-like isoform X2 [Xenopus laevis]